MKSWIWSCVRPVWVKIKPTTFQLTINIGFETHSFFGDAIFTVMDEYDCAFMLIVQGVYDIGIK